MRDLDPKALFADLLDTPAPPLPARADVLTGARRRLRRRHTARVAAAVGSLALVLSGAGALALGITPLDAGPFAGQPAGPASDAPPPPASWSPPSDQVACAKERSANSDLSVVPWPAGQSPVEVCRKEMSLLYKIRHRTLYTCVYRSPTDDGGVIVIPGEGYSRAAAACGSVDMYVAPDGIAPNPRPGGERVPDPETTG